MYIHICTYVYICTYIYIYLYIKIYVNLYIYIYPFVASHYLSVYISLSLDIYIYISQGLSPSFLFLERIRFLSKILCNNEQVAKTRPLLKLKVKPDQ